MNIIKENNELVLRIPLWQTSFDAIGEEIGKVPNLVGFSDGKDFSINYLCDLGYKGDIQLGMQIIYFNDKEELEVECKKLGLDILEYNRCYRCDETLFGSFTMDDNGGYVCQNCEEGEEKEKNCDHICSGNCRRVGCNCECGEWHK